MINQKLKKKMRRAVVAIMTAVIGFSGSGVGTISSEASSNNQVIFFTDENCGGSTFVHTGNAKQSLTNTKFNKQISALWVGRDAIVTLKDADGNALMLTGGRYNSLRHWNDRAVSVEVMYAPGVQDVSNVGNQKATLYKDGDFGGDSTNLPYDRVNLQGYRVGTYGVSSARVNGDARVILEGDNNRRLELWRGNYSWLGDYNDKAVKVVVTPFDAGSATVSNVTVGGNFAQDKVTFCGESNGIGDRLVLGVGEHSYEGTIGISSMYIPQGYLVTVYNVKTSPLKTYDPVVSRTYSAGMYNDLFQFDDKISSIKIEKLGGVEYTLATHRLAAVHNWEKQEKANGRYVMGDTIKATETKVTLSDEYATAKSQQDEKVSTVFAGTSTLNNRSGQDQNMTSQEFEFTEENSVTTSVSHGFGTEVTGSTEFEIAGLSMGVSIAASYDFSTTNDVTETQSITYKVPAQYVTVPAGKTVKVVARLDKVKTKGTVNLHANANVQDKGTFVGYLNKGSAGWGSMPQQSFNLNYTAPVLGEGSYEAEYAANLYIDIVEVGTEKVLDSGKSQVMVIEDRAGNSARVIGESMTFDLTK